MTDLKAKRDYDDYEHVYEGMCKQVVEGAIYRKELLEADKAGRICRVPYDLSPAGGHILGSGLWG
jgi:phage terminase large subunit